MKELTHKVIISRSLRENHIPSFKIQLKSVSSSKLIPKLSRFINKYLYKLGLGCSVNRYDNTLCLYSSMADNNLYGDFHNADIFCNFGSGAFYHKRWTNYDYPGQSSYYQALQGVENKDFYSIDLCEENLRLPLNDDSVSLIYCSHILEHLGEQSSLHFLAECYRVLKKSGVIRIVVPSTDNDHKIASIISRQGSIPVDVKKKIAAQVGHHILDDTSALEEGKAFNLLVGAKFDPISFYEKCVDLGVNNNFTPSNPGRHISFWDYEKILRVSDELGFEYCIPMYQGSSLASPFENLSVFDNTEPQLSLYLELVK